MFYCFIPYILNNISELLQIYNLHKNQSLEFSTNLGFKNQEEYLVPFLKGFKRIT